MSTPTETDPLLPPKQLDSQPKDSQPNDPARAEAQPKSGPVQVSRTTRYMILAGIWSATFISSLNWTLVPTMLPAITSEFEKSHQASWLGTAYLLATCTFTPLYGRLCGVFGRQTANQTAVFLAGLGTLLCGLSQDMNMLIAARFIAGMGGGGIFTTCSVIISDLYSLRSRGLTQGVASIFVGLGMGLGGTFGGVVTDWIGWRWGFLLQLPVFLLSFILTEISLHYPTPGKGKSPREIAKRIDYFGSLFLLLTIGSFLILLSKKYNEELPWLHPSVVTPLGWTIVFLLAFLFVEMYISPEPILPPFLLKQAVPVIVGTSNFLAATCTFTVFYYYPMWFQTVMLTSASEAGLHLVPNAIFMSTGSIFAGLLIHYTGKYWFINLTLGSFPLIAALLMSLMRTDSGTFLLWFSIVPMGFGNAVVLQTMLVALLARLPERFMAVGTGFAHLYECVGQVCGVAISSAIFQSRLDHELMENIKSPEIVRRIRQSARLVRELPPDLQKIATEAYGVSIRSVFIFAACMSVIAYTIRLFIRDKNLEFDDEDGSVE